MFLSLPRRNSGVNTRALAMQVGSLSAGACLNLDAGRFTRRRCAPASRPAIWCVSTESDCGFLCGNRNFRGGRIMHGFSQLCGFGQKRWRLACSGPMAQLMIMRARRPRSQETSGLWSRYHAVRSRAKRAPANAETLTLRISVPRGPSMEAWADRVSQSRQCVRLTHGSGHG